MSSKVVRSFRERATLASNRSSIVAVELRGYIFFGSAIRILKDIKKTLLVEKIVLTKYDDDKDGGDKVDVDAAELLSKSINGLVDRRGLIRMPNHLCNLLGEVTPLSHRKAETKFLLLDFSHVAGLDATAARSLFATLLQLLSLYNITLIITSANSSVHKILSQHGIIADDNKELVKVFLTADEGLEWCEGALLAKLGRGRPLRNTTAAELEVATTSMDALIQILQANMQDEQIETLDLISKTHILERYFKKINLQKGDPIFDEGDSSKEMYFIAKGSLTLYHNMPPAQKPETTWVERSKLIPKKWKPSQDIPINLRERVLRYDSGGIIGELDFTLRQPRSFSSEALEDTTVFVLSRDDLSAMAKEHPQIAIGVQHRLLTSLSVSATNLLSLR